MSTLSLKIVPLIPFIAVAHLVERGDGTRELAIDSCISFSETDQSRYRHYANYKLKSVGNVSSMHHYQVILKSLFRAPMLIMYLAHPLWPVY